MMPNEPTQPPAAANVGAPTVPNQPGARAPRYATGFFHPRWLLLAGVSFMIVAVIGFGVHFYFNQNPCNFGALCNLDSMPAPGQVALIWLGFMIILFIAASFGRSQDPDHQVDPSPLWRLTEYQRVRPLSWILAGLVGLGMVAEILRGQLDGLTLALGVVCLFVLMRCATYHPPRPEPPPGQRETPEQLAHQRSLRRNQSFWSVARNTRPFSWILRTRHE